MRTSLAKSVMRTKRGTRGYDRQTAVVVVVVVILPGTTVEGQVVGGGEERNREREDKMSGVRSCDGHSRSRETSGQVGGTP